VWQTCYQNSAVCHCPMGIFYATIQFRCSFATDRHVVLCCRNVVAVVMLSMPSEWVLSMPGSRFAHRSWVLLGRVSFTWNALTSGWLPSRSRMQMPQWSSSFSRSLSQLCSRISVNWLKKTSRITLFSYTNFLTVSIATWIIWRIIIFCMLIRKWAVNFDGERMSVSFVLFEISWYANWYHLNFTAEVCKCICKFATFNEMRVLRSLVF